MEIIPFDFKNYKVDCVGIVTHLFRQEGAKEVWLPLEHQLWEMAQQARTNVYAFENLLCKFAGSFISEDADSGWFVKDWARGKDDDCFHLGFTSLWQLLLAFVYHELYNKVWNGEDWVKE
ncbi:hypothetical protein ES708_30467 [subsurface metagenome]